MYPRHPNRQPAGPAADRRPVPRRHHARRPGPASPPPTPPRSGKHRRHQLKVAYWRLAKLLHRPVAELVELPHPTLATLAAQLGRGSGQAVRLANKVGRLSHAPAR